MNKIRKYLFGNKIVTVDDNSTVKKSKVLVEKNYGMKNCDIHNDSVICVIETKRYSFRLFVRLMNGNTIEIGILKNDTISDITKKIGEKIKIDPDRHRLVFMGAILDCNKTTAEYNICDKSVIQIVSRRKCELQISARTVDGKSITIEINENEKIRDIKKKIDPDEQKLIFLENILDDDKTADGYKICDKSVIDLVVELECELQLLVRTMNGKSIEIKISRNGTIRDIKKEIQKILSFNLDEQKLIFHGEILDDDKKVNEYKICDKSIIYLVSRRRGGMVLFVNMKNGKTIAIDIPEDGIIRDIKEKIEENLGIDPDEQKLFFHGSILDECKSLCGYEIFDKSAIDLVVPLKLLVSVKSKEGGQRIEIVINENESIRQIKHKIEEKFEIHPDEENLFFEGSILDDYSKSEECDKYIFSLDVQMRLHIFVKLRFGALIAMDILNDGTIRDIKKKVKEQLGVDPDEQELRFQGAIIDDDETLDECGICDGSVIDFVVRQRDGMQIFVKSVDGKTFAIDISKNETIRILKYFIQEKLGYHPDQQRLLFAGSFLDADKTVDECRICHESTISVVLKLLGGMQIYAKTMDGKTIAIEIAKNTTIREIKKKIQERLGHHPDEQKLVFLGGILEDDKTVGECRICEKSVINVVVRQRNGMLIYVKSVDGTFIAIDILTTWTIRFIKKSIQEELGMDPDAQILIFAGSILQDDKTADEYRLQPNSVIDLVSALKPQILVKMMDGKTIAFEIDNDLTIREMKKKIGGQLGIDPGEQKLIFKGSILDDDKTAGECKICDKSVISLDVPLRPQIFVIMKGEKLNSMEINERETIREAIKKIQEKLGIDPDKQKLLFQEFILDVDKREEAYKIFIKSASNVSNRLKESGNCCIS